jgi:hypothetical protein
MKKLLGYMLLGLCYLLAPLIWLWYIFPRTIAKIRIGLQTRNIFMEDK